LHATTATQKKQQILVASAVVFVVILLDQWLKYYIKTTFTLGESRMMIGLSTTSRLPLHLVKVE